MTVRIYCVLGPLGYRLEVWRRDAGMPIGHKGVRCCTTHSVEKAAMVACSIRKVMS